MPDLKKHPKTYFPKKWLPGKFYKQMFRNIYRYHTCSYRDYSNSQKQTYYPNPFVLRFNILKN